MNNDIFPNKFKAAFGGASGSDWLLVRAGEPN